MRIALATSDTSGEPLAEDALLAEALGERGATADIVDWRRSQRWDRYETVVVRSTWNYQDHHSEFLEWIDDVASQTVILNPAELMKTNTVKTYMRVLEERGVPIVPTQWITAENIDELHPQGAVVVKPSVGATGSGLRLFQTAAGIEAHVEALFHLGEVMVQPFLRTVAEIGETSVIFIGGTFTHAIQKVAREGEFRVQSDFGGSYGLTDPSQEMVKIAEQALDAIATDRHSLAYARVDLVVDEDGSPLIGEVELVEPDLFLALKPQAARLLADHIVSTDRSV